MGAAGKDLDSGCLNIVTGVYTYRKQNVKHGCGRSVVGRYKDNYAGEYVVYSANKADVPAPPGTITHADA